MFEMGVKTLVDTLAGRLAVVKVETARCTLAGSYARHLLRWTTRRLYRHLLTSY